MNIKQRVKNFQDVLNYHKISQEEFDKKVEGLTGDEKAYIQLKYIVEAFNEGWVPDWTNNEWDKYYPWFYMDDKDSSGRFSFNHSDYRSSASAVGSRLCFKSRELCDYSAELFLDIYKEFFTVK